MSDQVRLLVGLENILLKARRRTRECEREEGRGDGRLGARYRDLVQRISAEIHDADRTQLEEYLGYMEVSLLTRLAARVESTKEEMVRAARCVVDGKHHLQELRHEFTDTLDRIRSVRERLSLDPFRPTEVRFSLGTHAPNADRPAREAHDLVREFLKG